MLTIQYKRIVGTGCKSQSGYIFVKNSPPEALSPNIQVADQAEVEGEEGVEPGGRRLQHGHNVY